MTILCTFPGRHGDLMWALPTVRAIQEATSAEVDLLVSVKYGSLQPLLREQPYLRACFVDHGWLVQETAPISPRRPGELPELGVAYDRIFHLGYDGWPPHTLPKTIEALMHRQWPDAWGPVPTIDLDRPWITTSADAYPFYNRVDVAVGFTDEWFELKLGVLALLQRAGIQEVWIGNSPRWHDEAGKVGFTWQQAAAILRTLPIGLTDCSALHVLACAVGTPQILLIEPNPHRHADVFYPYGKTGRETLILGGDGQPTFDSRHVRDAVYAALQKAGR